MAQRRPKELAVLCRLADAGRKHSTGVRQGRAGFSATTTTSRSDFGIDFNVPLDAGGVLIGDKITVELEVQLVPAD